MGVWPIPHRPPLTATPTSGQNHPHPCHLSSLARPLTLLQPTRPPYPLAQNMQPHHNRPSTHQRKCASQPARQHPLVQTTSESPYLSVLRGKKINQRLCTMKYDWDEYLPQDIEEEFRQWLSDVEKLKDMAIPRSFGLKDADEEVEMHIFVDASMVGYGAVAYFVRADKEVVWVAARSSPCVCVCV